MQVQPRPNRMIAALIVAVATLVVTVTSLCVVLQQHSRTGLISEPTGSPAATIGEVYAGQAGYLADAPGDAGDQANPVAEGDRLSVSALDGSYARVQDQGNGSQGWISLQTTCVDPANC